MKPAAIIVSEEKCDNIDIHLFTNYLPDLIAPLQITEKHDTIYF